MSEPIFQRDEKGEIIYEKDEDENLVLDQNNDPIPLTLELSPDQEQSIEWSRLPQSERDRRIYNRLGLLITTMGGDPGN